ncbi:MAG: nucleotidyltransferase domain-containing protein [Candidatus Helarchaeota archaeon]
MGHIDDREVNKTIKKFCQKLKTCFDSKVQIYLFGSRATKTHLRSSDVDLLVVSDKFDQLSFRDRIINIIQYWTEDRISLEPICLTNTEFQRRRNEISIIREAIRTGIKFH